EARQKAKRGRERILAGYTWQRVVDRYEERLRALALRTPRRFLPDHLDPARFNAQLDPLEIDGLRGFNFLAHPCWDAPAWNQVLGAYLRTFSQEDDVALVLRVEDDPLAAERLVERIQAMGHDPDAVADIILVQQALAKSRAGALYVACQAYVDLGDDRRRREAMACGLAVITEQDDLAQIIRLALR
ncbi:MAG: hypothetical protein KGR26_04680, partial [Cyanobacteria bacterium REEB65]|nr:hypothetical protein [Cyanobacteria bacterium REEB65]